MTRDDPRPIGEAETTAAAGPGLPGFHWYSSVVTRGWEQPQLDGRNGGQPTPLDGQGPPCFIPEQDHDRTRLREAQRREHWSAAAVPCPAPQTVSRG